MAEASYSGSPNAMSAVMVAREVFSNVREHAVSS